jgi:lipid II:glycine glycyltransferase (peptidoglycan interpeptide bridge formation enzyme)
MEIKDILAMKSNNLFQSESWADVQSALNKKNWMFKGDYMQAMVIKVPLIGKKSYFYCPRGPLTSSRTKTQDLKVFLKKIESVAWEEGVVFLRVEPYALEQSDLYKFGFRKTGFYSPLSRQHSPEIH